MKLDDRDIICEQDYSPLSNAELVAAIERYADIMSNAPLIDFDLEWITGPARALLARAEVLEVAFANSHELNETLGNENRALLARAEAAEASREALADRLVFEMEQRETLADRVAELEAQLAAQQWLPVTEDDPTPLEHVVIQTRDGADVGWRLPELRHLWQTRRGRTYVNEELRGWLALPPLPPPPAAAQEPTP